MLTFLIWGCRITLIMFAIFFLYFLFCLIRKKSKKVSIIGCITCLCLFILFAVFQNWFHAERVERELVFLNNPQCYDIKLDNRKKALQIWDSIKVNQDDSYLDSVEKSKRVGEVIGELSYEEWFDYDYVYYDTWGEETGRIVTVTIDMSDLSVDEYVWIE